MVSKQAVARKDARYITKNLSREDSRGRTEAGTIGGYFQLPVSRERRQELKLSELPSYANPVQEQPLTAAADTVQPQVIASRLARSVASYAGMPIAFMAGKLRVERRQSKLPEPWDTYQAVQHSIDQDS